MSSDPAPAPGRWRPGIAPVLALMTTLAGAVLIAMPELMGGTDAFGLAAGAVIIAVGLWATAAVPPYYTSLIFMLLAVGLAVAPANVVFSGFHSTAVWLVFGGIVLGLAVQTTGLGDRLVQGMLRRFPLSYRGLVFALALTGVALGFVIPSAAGRVLILMPVVLALTARLGFPPGTNGHTGMVLAAGLGTTIPSFGILPANVPNMGLIGAAESIYGVTFTYGEYLLLNFTVMGLLSALAIPAIIYWLYPDRTGDRPVDEAPGAWTGNERKLLVVLALGLGLWATDFLHGVSPAWVAMAAAVVIMLPRWGVLPPTVIANRLEYGPWIFVAGIIGLGAVVNETGLGAAIARQVFAVVPLAPGADLTNFFAMWGVGAAAGLVTTLPASPAILTPLAQGMAEASGWPLDAVLMTQVPVWLVFGFPYQAPPIIVALAMGGVSPVRALRVMLPYLAFGIVVMLPLQYLWGSLLGVYP